MPSDWVSSRRQGLAWHDQPSSPSTKEKACRQANGPLYDHCKKGSLGVHSQAPDQLAYPPNLQWSSSHPIYTACIPKPRTTLLPPPDLIEGAEHYKVEKYLIVDFTKYGESRENYPGGLQTTSSNGRTMNQNQTVGYEKTTWTWMNSLRNSLLNTSTQ